MQKILGTILMALVLVTGCHSKDGGISTAALFDDLGSGAGTGGTSGGTGGTGGGAGGGGSQTYSATLLGMEVQKKGSTDSVAVTGLPVDGATVTGP